MKRILLLVVFAVFIAAGSALASPTSPILLASDPEDGAKLPAAPSEVTLTFSEPLDEAYSRIEVYACGKRVSAATETVTGGQMSVPVTKGLKGKYRVFYFANAIPKGATGETTGTLTFKVTKGKPCP